MNYKNQLCYIAIAAGGMVWSTAVYALPEYARATSNSCSVCHTQPADLQPEVEGGGIFDGREVTGIMQVTRQGVSLDLGTQLGGQNRGSLMPFAAAPGDTVTLEIDVTGMVDEHAVQLKRLETGGQLNDAGNLLVWAEANDAGNPWTRQEDANPPYFTKGILQNTSDGTYGFDLMIDSTTPPDVYDLEFAVAGHDSTGLFYQDEHFYLLVVDPTAPIPLVAQAAPNLINISTRGLVSTGDEIMIGGFWINGTQSKTVLIRAAGPALVTLGLDAGIVLQDPVLTLYSQADTSTPIGSNDNWGDAANAADIEATAAAVFAFGFPAGSLDAAMLVTLEPGGYTAQVSGGDGVAIIEAYEID